MGGVQVGRHSLPRPLEARAYPASSLGWEGGQDKCCELHQGAYKGLGHLRGRTEAVWPDVLAG